MTVCVKVLCMLKDIFSSVFLSTHFFLDISRSLDSVKTFDNNTNTILLQFMIKELFLYSFIYFPQKQSKINEVDHKY